jgi:UDP-N-acetylmuramate: L-alanyl-gamma-D-glutamyl-meso-diaminopimelate ligase
MRMGIHVDALGGSLAAADESIIYQAPDLGWDAERVAAASDRIHVNRSIEAIVERLRYHARPGDHIVFMSNGGFGGIHAKAADALRERAG